MPSDIEQELLMASLDLSNQVTRFGFAVHRSKIDPIEMRDAITAQNLAFNKLRELSAQVSLKIKTEDMKPVITARPTYPRTVQSVTR